MVHCCQGWNSKRIADVYQRLFYGHVLAFDNAQAVKHCPERLLDPRPELLVLLFQLDLIRFHWPYWSVFLIQLSWLRGWLATLSFGIVEQRSLRHPIDLLQPLGPVVLLRLLLFFRGLGRLFRVSGFFILSLTKRMLLEFQIRSDSIANQLLSGLVVGILFFYEDIPTMVEVE